MIFDKIKYEELYDKMFNVIFKLSNRKLHMVYSGILDKGKKSINNQSQYHTIYNYFFGIFYNQPFQQVVERNLLNSIR